MAKNKKLSVMGGENSSPFAKGPVEIWFEIQKDEECFPTSQDWEELWATPIEGGGFRLESTPFFVKDIALGDIVSAERTKEDWYKFERIISRSGNSNFRIWLDDTAAQGGGKIAQELRTLGCKVEITLERLIAIDVSADREPDVWDYLQAGQAHQRWEVQVGFSPD
jgi:hypothetical protein